MPVFTASVAKGVVVPIPTRPSEETLNNVLVASAPVVGPSMLKRARFEALDVADIVSMPSVGVVVPIPTFCALLRKILILSVDVAHFEFGCAHAADPTRPDAMLRQPSARVSMRSFVVDATPLTEIAVVEAYGKVEADDVVAVKYAATAWPTTDNLA